MRSIIVKIAILAVLFTMMTSHAQWTQMQGLYGEAAVTRCIAAMDSVLFLGTAGAGVYRSVDGQNWKAVNEGLPIRYINALCVYGTLLFAGGEEGGIYVTADNGESWVPCMLMTPTDAGEYINCLCVRTDLVFTPVFFAGTSHGKIYKSEDNGATWWVSTSGLLPVHCLITSRRRMSLVSSVFAGTDRGVYRYEGGVWNKYNNGLQVDTLVYSMTYLGDYIYAVGIPNLYRSADLGGTWEYVAGPGQEFVIAWEGNLYMSTEFDGIRLSRDSGGHWESAGFDASKEPWHLAFARGNLYAATFSNGVWRRPLQEILTLVPQEVRTAGPDAFALGQNYPNPFNSTTTIVYTLPDRSQVLLTIFDTSGRQIATPVDGVEGPGSRSVVFDATGLASGIYFYQLHCGNFSYTRRLVLLR
jgi:hypothetical protein